jgi:putative transposase
VGQNGILRPIGNRPSGRFTEKFSRGQALLVMTAIHRRRLPHYQSVGSPIFLTWRLHGSLPPNRCFAPATTAGQAFLAMDRILDSACAGPLYLRQPDIADMVVEAIRYRQPEQYALHSYVVMANHVHLLITPRIEVSCLMQSLKRFTAREANRMLELTGRSFWQEESYDHSVRAGEFQRIARYIEMNPVNAGLAATPEEFLWSSAWPITNRPQNAILPHLPGS